MLYVLSCVNACHASDLFHCCLMVPPLIYPLSSSSVYFRFSLHLAIIEEVSIFPKQLTKHIQNTQAAASRWRRPHTQNQNKEPLEKVGAEAFDGNNHDSTTILLQASIPPPTHPLVFTTCMRQQKKKVRPQSSTCTHYRHTPILTKAPCGQPCVYVCCVRHMYHVCEPFHICVSKKKTVGKTKNKREQAHTHTHTHTHTQANTHAQPSPCHDPTGTVSR
jgi:hypothetical protein